VNVLEEESLSLLKLLCRNKVRFILVGGLAVNFYGYSRTTGDIDIWLEDTPENRENLIKALKEYGIEGAEIFQQIPFIAGYTEVMLDNGIYLDLMADLKLFPQRSFEDSYKNCEDWQIDNETIIKVIQLKQLIAEKETTARLKDQDDVMQLKNIPGKHQD
jgi:predicted nucleotidyltransferase